MDVVRPAEKAVNESEKSFVFQIAKAVSANSEDVEIFCVKFCPAFTAPELFTGT